MGAHLLYLILNSSSFKASHTITLCVGEKGTPLEVNSNILLRSNVLRKRLETFQGNDFIGLNVPETTPDIMELYLAFVHTGPHKVTLPDNKVRTIQQRYHELARIYIASKRLDNLGAKNDVAIAMLNLAKTKDITGSTQAPCPRVVGLIYGSTTPGSPIRRLMADLWIPLNIATARNITGDKNLPPAFLKDVIDAITKRAEMESGGLEKVLAALMQLKEVQQLRNQAVAKGSDAYMES